MSSVSRLNDVIFITLHLALFFSSSASRVGTIRDYSSPEFAKHVDCELRYLSLSIPPSASCINNVLRSYDTSVFYRSVGLNEQG